MKKYLLKPISACLIAIALFTGCNKDSVEANDPNKDSDVATLVGEEDPSGTGSITGIVLPAEADPTVYLYGNTTIKVLVNPDGSIARNSVPAGDYTVQVHPANPNYGDHMINDIEVVAGKPTDLGTIILVKKGG